MKVKRLLAGLMSLAMLCSVTSTPIYALEDGTDPGAAPIQSEPAPEESPTPEKTPAAEEPPASEGTPVPEESPANEPTAAPSPEKSPSPETTPEPEGTPVPAATPTPAENGEEKETTPALANPLLVAPRTGAGNSSFADVAEEYYGDDAQNPLPVGKVSMQWSSVSVAEDELRAGNVVSLVIDFVLNASATYNYTSYEESLFDSYENTTITLTLPEHVSIDLDEAGALENVSDIENLGDRTWKLVLSQELPAGSSFMGTVVLPLLVEGNGALPVGTLLDFETCTLTMETSFTVMDRTNPADVKPYKTYFKTINGTNSLTNKTLITDDVWGIQKIPGLSEDDASGAVVVSADKSTVTASFFLKVGLLTNGVVNTNSATYERPGRVPLEGELMLTETPFVLDRDGNSLQPRSITVTPQFGEGTPLIFTAGEPMALPLRTCSDSPVALNVDGNAPYLSTYVVEAVYDYDPFIANYYEEKQSKLTIDNTAAITYQLKGENAPRTDESKAQVEAGEVTQPAALQLQKYLLNTENTAALYATADTVIQGPAQFTITDAEDPDAPVTLYVRNQDGTYQKLEDNTVTINPKGSGSANGSGGTLTVYLNPGRYTVTEMAMPQNTVAIAATDGDQGKNSAPKTLTLAQNQQSTAAFYNRENVGTLILTKQGPNAQGENVVLSGAGFALYSDAACTQTVATGTTDANGQLRFDRLSYGTYYLKETDAPDGYALSTQVETITLTGENPLVHKTVQDNRNLAYAKLEKQRQEGSSFAPITGSLAAQLNGAFKVQKKVGDQWQDVEGQTGLSLNSTTGQLVLELPVYDDQNQPITYRFHETLPEGWHNVNDPGAAEAFTDGFTLVDNLGKTAAEATAVVLRNKRDTALVIDKTFYGMTANGLQPLADVTQEATFRLYSRVGTTGNVTPYLPGNTFTTADGTLTIEDLPRVDGSGTSIQYFLEEVPMTAGTDDLGGTLDFVLVDEQTGTNTAEEKQTTVRLADGRPVKAFGPFDFDEMPVQTIELRNEENAGGLLIKKQDATNGAFVPGAQYTANVKNGSGSATGTVEDAGGAFVKVKAGQAYTVTESAVPAGYHPYYGEGASATGWESGTVDKGEVVTVVMENLPDPTLTVEKEIRNWAGEEGATTQNGVEFTVYRYDPVNETLGAQVMTRVDGKEVPLKVISGGTPIHLEPGQYVLKEINVPGGVVNPDAHMDQYANVEGTIQLVIPQTDPQKTELFFGPVTLSAVTKDGDEWKTGTTFQAINLSDKGALRVKKVDENGNPLAGATFIAYKEDPAGEDIEVDRATSDTKGVATFTGLPIYEEDGSQIIYFVKETDPPAGYSVDNKDSTGDVLTAGTVTEVEDPFVNTLVGSFTVTKVYYNLWEHSFTGKEYVLPGTRVALFAQDGAAYKFKELATADDLGQVHFTDLRQDTTYVAAEYDIPEGSDYAYLEPQHGVCLIELSGFENPEHLEGKSLTALQMDGLNHVTYQANGGKDQTGTLINVEHWAQLHIKKYVYNPGYTAPESQADSQTDSEQPINNAQFALYQEILDETTADNATLSYDPTNADKYTLIGRYSSGTLYDPESEERLDGWFGTDILQAGTHVVYWLVEESAGIGADFNPENQITLIRMEGTSYKNQSTPTHLPKQETGIEHSTNVLEYVRDRVTKDKLENLPVEGPGNAQFATVRITKWADSYDDDGTPKEEYKALGNATFAIYLAHEDGTTAALLDTITTGLDNTQLEDKENLTAWASSYAFSYQGLWEAYRELDEGDYTANNWDIFKEEADGSASVRLILREISAPAGYSTPDHEFRMTLYFQKVEEGKGASETFNDLFYVKNTDKAVPQAGTIGDDWPCYAVDPDGTLVKGEEQYRLVNLPIDNFAVTVTKYGYTVHDDNLNMTSAQLDAYYDEGTNGDDRVPLQVTMKLQRYNGTDKKWVDYVFTHADGKESATFTTTGGWYAFPNGLPVGRYRLIETSGAAGYLRMYDGSALPGDDYYNAKAYYFAIATDNLNLALYNPQLLSLTVAKTGTDGKLLKGTVFQLNGQSKTTDDSGYAEFDNLTGGVYRLKETKATDGYSSSYLEACLKATYPTEQYSYTSGGKTYSLEKFATDGNDGGIYLGLETARQGNEMVVTNKVDLTDYGLQDPLMINLKDPAKGSLEITKTDSQTGAVLSGATFTLEYKAFENWSGTQELTGKETGWSTAVAETAATGTNGKVTVSSLEPGIYKITEKTAPDNYTADPDPRYAIVTGGMDQTVTWKDTTLTNEAAFTNTVKVALTVIKNLDTGSLDLQQNETFTFTLSQDGKEISSQTVEFTKGAANGTTKSATFSGLEQGKTYTLTETAHSGFVLTGMTSGGTTLDVTTDKDGNGSVQVTMPTTGADLEVIATNRALQGSITLQKQDGTNDQPLAGATFTITRTGTPVMQPITVTTDAQGSATAVVPLTSEDGNDFTITETAAPDGYVLKANTVTVTVTPGAAVAPTADNDLIINNYPGVKIQLTKYDNTKEGRDPVVQSGATFALYRKDGETWTFADEAATDANGVLTFTVEDDKVYAVVENPIPDGYQSLEGLWDGSKWMPTESDGSRTYYLINDGNPLELAHSLYQYNAYNIPFARLEVRKQDALHPAADAQPTATVDLYEVPADTSATMTGEEVSALVADTEKAHRVARDLNLNLDGGDTVANIRFKYALLDNVVVGGKTYLALETDSAMTQIRDHNQEVWYVVFTVPVNTDGHEVVTLKNVAGQADLNLSKSTTTANYESLMAAPAQLEYTLTPPWATTPTRSTALC